MAFSWASSTSAPWPTSAVYVTTSAPYSSMSHRRMIDVSRPPLYASTTFLMPFFMSRSFNFGGDRRRSNGLVHGDEHRVVSCNRAKDAPHPGRVDPAGHEMRPVSYTHLTLPTILRV